VVSSRSRSRKQEKVLQPPIWTAHADYIHPFDFVRFAAETRDLNFDIMLEAKAKDLALQRLRRDITFYAPELQERFDAGGTREMIGDVEVPLQEFESSKHQALD
jgi:UV DNA damage endonuclease